MHVFYQTFIHDVEAPTKHNNLGRKSGSLGGKLFQELKKGGTQSEKMKHNTEALAVTEDLDKEHGSLKAISSERERIGRFYLKTCRPGRPPTTV
jgi:hypothetical protein